VLPGAYPGARDAPFRRAARDSRGIVLRLPVLASFGPVIVGGVIVASLALLAVLLSKA
jgi:hypothetical protein